MRLTDERRIRGSGKMAKEDVTRRDISASAEILAERVRVRPVKKHTRTTEYDFNYELISRTRAYRAWFREEDTEKELHRISSEFEKARSTFRAGIMLSRYKYLARSHFRFEARADLRGIFYVPIRLHEHDATVTARHTVDQYNRIGKRIGREGPIAFGRLSTAELTRWLTRVQTALPMQVISASRELTKQGYAEFGVINSRFPCDWLLLREL